MTVFDRFTVEPGRLDEAVEWVQRRGMHAVAIGDGGAVILRNRDLPYHPTITAFAGETLVYDPGAQPGGLLWVEAAAAEVPA